MKTHTDIEQRSEAWFKIRLGVATGSNFSKAVSKGRGGAASKTRADYMYKLAFERVHGIPFPDKFQGNSSMDWGTETEDEGRIAFMTQTGLVVDQVGFIEYDDDVGFSPDGLIGDDGDFEIKCPDTLTHMKYLQGMALPKAYNDRMQGGMWIAERDYCWFVSYDPRYPSQPLHKRLIRRDEKAIKELRIGLVMFVQELKELTEKLKPKALF